MLYVCPTPIGNLEDITLRVLRILKEADLIVAEDTRHTRKLLTHYGISQKLKSLHQHNEYSKADEVIQMLIAGKDIALVSDAGMPGISDPGAELIRQTIAMDLPVTVLPGANAAITAIVQSGLLADQFLFYGFLPRKKQQLQQELLRLKTLACPIILYEAPHRLLQTLETLYEHLGNRKTAISRELTKMFEETRRGTLQQMIEYFSQNKPRGEFILVIAGEEPSVVEMDRESFDVHGHIVSLLSDGMSKKEAIKATAKLLGVAKNEIYQQVLDLDQ